jgi:hypothetical protein
VAGFTLVEVMMAALVLVGAGFGVYACLLKAYQVVAVGRYRDAARAVLQTYADQFERLETADQYPIPTGPAYTRWFFKPTNGPTATGLLWDNPERAIQSGGLNMFLNTLCNEPATNGAKSANDGVAYLRVNLGGSNNVLGSAGNGLDSTSLISNGIGNKGIEAHVTREVWGIDDNGNIIPAPGVKYDSAGELLLGRFTITYTVFDQPYILSLTVLRAAQVAQ